MKFSGLFLILAPLAVFAAGDDKEERRNIRGRFLKSANVDFLEPYDCSQIAPCKEFKLKNSCHAFYPKRFWSSDFAKEFAPGLHFQRIRRPTIKYERELLMLTRRNKSHDDYKEPPAQCANKLPDSITYLHNFKAGGTTALSTFGKQSVPHYVAESNHKVFTQYMWNEDMIENSFNALNELQERQANESTKDIAFTFTRSPVKRFLSGIAQIDAMGYKNEAPWYAQECFEKDNKEAKVECIVEKIKTGMGRFFNVHLYPQMYLMDSWTNGGLNDIQVVVMDLEDMNSVFNAMVPEIIREREAQAGQKIAIADLSPKVIESICELYKMDVVALQLMGMDDGICPYYLSKQITENQDMLEAIKNLLG